MISNIISSILNPAATISNADKAAQLQADNDRDRPVVATALAAKAVATGLGRQSVDQSNKSDQIDYFHAAKQLIRDALKDFSHGVHDSFDMLGFGDGMAGKLTKAVMAHTKDALLWGVGFSVKLMTATVTQTTSSDATGALPTFSVMARSVEIKINHSEGLIDVDTDKVTIESQFSGAPGAPEARLLDISDSDEVPTSNLATALQALGDPKALFENLEEELELKETTGETGRRADEVVSEEALPKVVDTPRVLSRPEFKSRILLSEMRHYRDDKGDLLTYIRLDALLPLTDKPAQPDQNHSSRPATLMTA